MPKTFVTFATPDGTCEAYLSAPDGPGCFAPVLFYMDGVGYRPPVHAMADRIAAAGYVVLLPNLFYRDGPQGPIDIAQRMGPENRPKLIAQVMSLTPDKVLSDAGAFLGFLAAQNNVIPGAKAGITGYCMGSSMAVRTAARYPAQIGAAAGFHGGRLVTDDPASPHRLLATVTAELVFGHADQDAGMPPEAIAAFDEALAVRGLPYLSELYTGALHGFTMTDLAVYNKAADDKHWQRLLALFGAALQRPQN